MTPRRLRPGDSAADAVLALIRAAFAPVPQSPAATMTRADLDRKLAEGSALLLEQDGRPLACVFTRPSRDVAGALYLGTLAVDAAARGRGLARQLVEAAAALGRARGDTALTLDTGAGLLDLQAVFAAMGFRITAASGDVVTMIRPLPHRLSPGAPALAEMLTLLHAAFAFMEGRIDPPSSLHRLDLAALDRQAAEAEVWALGAPLAACVVLTPRPGRIYLGKLAVNRDWRGHGLARQLIALAETRARARSLPVLELQTRVELTENHAAFRRLGFVETGRSAHAGFDRATAITFQRPVPGV